MFDTLVHVYETFGSFICLILNGIKPAKEPKGVNFKDDYKSDRYTNARKSIFVPASGSQLENNEDDKIEEKTNIPSESKNLQNIQTNTKQSKEPEITQIHSAFLTTESSSDQLKKTSSPPKTPPKTIHIHTHIPSVPNTTFDNEIDQKSANSPEVTSSEMTSLEDNNPKVNVYKVFDRIS